MPSAPSSSSHPAASSTRGGGGGTSKAAGKHDHRRNPANQRSAREQPQPRQLALSRLAAKLEPHRLLGAAALLVELRPLELQPGVITVERFLERGDDDVGQRRLELPGKALHGGR